MSYLGRENQAKIDKIFLCAFFMVANYSSHVIIPPMPRRPRIVVNNTPHHIYQRSASGKALFFTENDYRAYLEILNEQADRYKTDILAWCLMRDHINLVATPRKKNSLAKTIGRTHFAYSQYIGKRRKRVGSLWHNRFQSCALDDNYLNIAAKYVECQPVYGGLVRKPQKFSWSSAKAHCDGNVDEFDLLALDVWPSKRSRSKWPEFLDKKLDEATQEKIRTYTQTGRPLGTKSFIETLEKKFRQRLHPLPIGRPPNEA